MVGRMLFTSCKAAQQYLELVFRQLPGFVRLRRAKARNLSPDKASIRNRSDLCRLLDALNGLFEDVSDQTLLLQQIADTARRTLKATHSLIWLRADPAKKNDVTALWAGSRPPSGLMTGHPPECLQRDALPVSRLKETPLGAALLEADITLVVPIIYQSDFIGWLGVGPSRRGQSYSREQQLFLEILACQAAMAIHTGRLRAELESSVVQLRRAYRQIIQAQEKERRQLAETLHDETLQHLADLSVRLGLLSRQPQIEPTDLVDLQTRLAGADRYLREVVRGVHPAVLSDLGLIEAVIAFLESVSLNHSPLPVRVELWVVGFKEERLPDQSLELALYRFTQNAASNALTHGRPDCLGIEFRWGMDRVVVTVKDDGCGMKTTVEAAARAGHFGLLTMRERIESFGGSFRLHSRPDRGTEVVGEVPLAVPSSSPGFTDHYAFELAGSP